jgi:membrane protease subunit (stomatin/prohibitin family)
MRTRRSPKNQDRLFKALGREKAPVVSCEWKEDWEGNWSTSCGEEYCITEGTPEENKMKFCAYCGKPLKQKLYEEGE